MEIEFIVKELSRLSDVVGNGLFDDAKEGSESLHRQVVRDLDIDSIFSE